MAKLVFNGDFNGTYQVRNQKLVLDKEDGLRPYDLTYGAIAGCLYSTFLNILELNDLNVDEKLFNEVLENKIVTKILDNKNNIN